MTRQYGQDDGDGWRDAARRVLLSTTWGRATVVFVLMGMVAIIGVPRAVRAPAGSDDGTAAGHRSHAAGTRAVLIEPAVIATAAARISTTPPIRADVRPVGLTAAAMSPASTKTQRPRVIRARVRTQTGKQGPAAPASAVTPEKAAAPEKKDQASAPAAGADAKAAAEKYWVQVGAYRDAEVAKRVAARLREQNYPVIESVLTRATAAGPAPAAPAPAPAPAATGQPGDRYEVVVSGPSQADVDAQIAAKGLAARSTPEGAVITPSLPLRDAVALSKDLSGGGITVKVRRVGTSGSATTTAASPAAGVETLYRIRVGGYADRSAALTVLRELEGKGYRPFLGRGSE